MKMSRFLIIGLCLSIVGGVAVADFVGYDPATTEMPGTGWTLVNGDDPIDSVSGGIAYMDTNASTGRYEYDNTGFDAATGLTVDFKVYDRLNSTINTGCSFQVGVDNEYRVIIHVLSKVGEDSGASRLKVSFSDGGDYYTDSVADRADLNYYHTWRFVSQGTSYAIYVDDQVAPVLSGTVDAGDRDADSVHFGDWGGTTNGNSRVDYVVWDNTQAIFSGPLVEVLFPGDANRDGVVTAGDYASIQSNFGDTGDPGIPGDADGNGTVSAGDYASVQANYGNIESLLTSVPEPATISLLILGGIALTQKRKS
jgi:hypothetical protein